MGRGGNEIFNLSIKKKYGAGGEFNEGLHSYRCLLPKYIKD
jgi:hypothetical protein